MYIYIQYKQVNIILAIVITDVYTERDIYMHK